MTNQEINKRFTKLCGLCWYETGYRFCGDTCRNPDFISDSRLVLVEMMKREDWPEFSNEIGPYKQVGISPFNYPLIQASEGIYYELILDTTGLLVKAAIEWLEKQNEL